MTKREHIPGKLRHRVFQRDGYRCRECGATNKETTLEIDHILPVSKGGTNDINNLQTLCKKCNRAKYTDTWVGGLPKSNINSPFYEGYETKNCPNCGSRIAKTKKYCGRCGYDFRTKCMPDSKIKICPKCGKEYTSKKQLCPSCIKKKKGNFKKCSICGNIYSEIGKGCPYCNIRKYTNTTNSVFRDVHEDIDKVAPNYNPPYSRKNFKYSNFKKCSICGNTYKDMGKGCPYCNTSSNRKRNVKEYIKELFNNIKKIIK